MKNIVKTESVAEFVARGGAIKKCPAKDARKAYKRIVKEAEIEEIEPVDMSALPANLKIRFGIR